MERVFFILPIAFGLILLPYATTAINVKELPPTQGEEPKNVNPLIEKACKSAKHTKICIQVLTKQPGSAKADVKTLTFLTLNVTKTFGVTNSDFIAKKLEDPELGPEIQQGLTDCSDQYTDAIAQLEDSLVAFFSNALNDVKTWLKTAVANANTCEEGLKSGNVEAVMGQRNHIFFGILLYYSRSC